MTEEVSKINVYVDVGVSPGNEGVTKYVLYAIVNNDTPPPPPPPPARRRVNVDIHYGGQQ